MTGGLLSNVNDLITTSPWLAFVAVFVGGILTASNPCVLAMIPLMMGFVGGLSETTGFKKSFLFAGVFVLGLAITFAILGVIAALVGRLLGDVGSFWKWIVVGVCAVMGLHMLGILKIPLPASGRTNVKATGVIGAFLLGMLFGVISTPCATPILVVLLTYIAAKGASVIYGALLLVTYALGHSLLILVAGTSVGIAKGLLESRGFTKTTGILRKIAGAVIILVGVYFAVFQ
jgi:cytochrome c biogenesis protein CcdA